MKMLTFFVFRIIELALEHVEEKTGVTLSRQVGTPNIASKGSVEARTVLIPKSLLHQAQNGTSTSKDEPLLREASTSSLKTKTKSKSQNSATPGPPSQSAASHDGKPKSILKKQISKTNNSSDTVDTNPELPAKRPLIEELTSVETHPLASVHPVGRVSPPQSTTPASANLNLSVDPATCMCYHHYTIQTFSK